MTRDPNFPRAPWAEECGIRAGFAFPVLVRREVVAILEFFSMEVQEPDQALLDVTGHVGTQLGRVVERVRAQRALRQAESRYRTLVERVPAVVYTAGFGEAGAWSYVGPQIETLLGFTPRSGRPTPPRGFASSTPRIGTGCWPSPSAAAGRESHNRQRLCCRSGTHRR